MIIKTENTVKFMQTALKICHDIFAREQNLALESTVALESINYQ